MSRTHDPSSERPEVALITLGGTIASLPPDDQGTGATPTLDAAALVRATPGLADVATIDPVPLLQCASPELGFPELFAVAREIHERVAAGAVGVVVTQGTDTIEETAFVLDLIVADDAPVVVSGAMRHPGLAGADGPANLLGAVVTACAPDCRGLGTLVVFTDEIHAGRFVRKSHTSSLATFRSDPLGPIGWIAEGRPRIELVPRTRCTFDVEGLSDPPSVPVVAIRPADDGAVLDAVIDRGVPGLVVEALGGGHVPARLVPRLQALAARVPVVLTSRTGGGEVLRSTYGFPGSEQDLLARGLVWAGRLDARKARVVLALSLAAGAGPAEAAEAFALVGGPTAPGTALGGRLTLVERSYHHC